MDTINNTVSKLLSSSSKPIITISLENPQSIYTTSSPLSGTVTIIAPTTTKFSSIDITLQGSTSTYVEKMTTAATNYRSTANHTFLRLVMPIQPSSYPTEKTLLANEVYKFPFNFAIPNHLLPQCCTHPCITKHVHFAHLSLPPSMGTSPQNYDLCPDMAKVMYAIKAKLSKIGESGKPQKLCEVSLPLNVLPALGEAPPMSIDAGDKDYSLSKSKVLKKGMFKGKLGRITLKAQQPRDFMLSVPSPSSHSSLPLTSSSASSSSPSMANFTPFTSSDSDNIESETSKTPSQALTHLNLTLNFTPDPSHPTAQPPRLSSLSSKIRSSTFYAARASTTFPLRSHITETYDPNSGLYESSMSLPSRNLASVSWVKNEPFLDKISAAPPLYELNDPVIRRSRRSSDSGYSTLSDNGAENANMKEDSVTGAGVSYTAQISLPLSLPAEKTMTWVPTFHSCLVSRIYTLEFSLSLTHGTIVPTTSLSLKVPIRIGVLAAGERRGNGIGPTVVVPATSEHRREDHHSRDDRGGLPPGYEVFVGAVNGRAQRRRAGYMRPTVSNPMGVVVDNVGSDGLSLTTGGDWSFGTGLIANGR